MSRKSPLRPRPPPKPTSKDLDSLHELGLLNLLKHDPRPTFVLDTADANHSVIEINHIFCNTALGIAWSGALQTAISGAESKDGTDGEDAASLSQFRHWCYHHDSSSTEVFPFCDYNWRRCLIAGRWVVINGTSIEASISNEEEPPSESVTHPRKNPETKFTTFDWTNDPPPAELSAHVLWARSIDWENTPLGPMRNWSPQLRSNASLVMQDLRPAVGFYGPELIMVYNEPYIELLGGLHPCMGRSAREVLAQVWNDYFEPVIQRNLAGETVDNSHTDIPLMRNGYIEETYFSTRFIPIFDSQGATIGHYEPVIEVVSTAQTLPNRPHTT